MTLGEELREIAETREGRKREEFFNKWPEILKKQADEADFTYIYKDNLPNYIREWDIYRWFQDHDIRYIDLGHKIKIKFL